MSLSIEKTNFIVFKVPRHSSETVTIKVGKQHLRQTKYVKFLGILLDEHLNWKHHLLELSKKLARTCGLFFKILQFLPTNVLICLYNSLFPSFLQYGIIVWGLTYESYTRPIYLLQRKIIRAIAFEHFTSPSAPIFLNLKILRLSELFQLKLLCFMYECINSTSPTHFFNFIVPVASVHQYTRQS